MEEGRREREERILPRGENVRLRKGETVCCSGREARGESGRVGQGQIQSLPCLEPSNSFLLTSGEKSMLLNNEEGGMEEKHHLALPPVSVFISSPPLHCSAILSSLFAPAVPSAFPNVCQDSPGGFWSPSYALPCCPGFAPIEAYPAACCNEWAVS